MSAAQFHDHEHEDGLVDDDDDDAEAFALDGFGALRPSCRSHFVDAFVVDWREHSSHGSFGVRGASPDAATAVPKPTNPRSHRSVHPRVPSSGLLEVLPRWVQFLLVVGSEAARLAFLCAGLCGDLVLPVQ
jgi:hypothetical protein